MPTKFRYKAGTKNRAGVMGRRTRGATGEPIGFSMSDDSFIREVNEEYRQDQAKALWERYGVYAITVAVLVIAVTAAIVGYGYWVENRSAASGDAFARAMALSEEGDDAAALEALRAIQADGYGSYPLLARMGAATVMADMGNIEQAVAEFDAVAADGGIPEAVRNMARLRAGLLLVDSGTYDEVARRVDPLTADGSALRHSAREALGLSAWSEGRAADALAHFERIAGDAAAPAPLRRRAEIMSELIRGSGTGAT